MSLTLSVHKDSPILVHTNQYINKLHTSSASLNTSLIVFQHQTKDYSMRIPNSASSKVQSLTHRGSSRESTQN